MVCDSSVGIALATGRTVRGSNPCGGAIFRMRPDRPWGPPILLYKAVGAWRRPLNSSSDEVKEKVELCLYSPSGLSWPVIGRTLSIHHLPTCHVVTVFELGDQGSVSSRSIKCEGCVEHISTSTALPVPLSASFHQCRRPFHSSTTNSVSLNITALFTLSMDSTSSQAAKVFPASQEIPSVIPASHVALPT